MSGELEAAGALATAGLVGAAIEGQASGQAGEGACTNCGAPVTGAYCSQCGQAAQPQRKLSRFVGEFIHGMFNFDTKAWRTIPMVLFRPGTLTRDYVYGRRVRYISPLATFLFAIFLMFFAFSFLQAPPGLGTTPEAQRQDAAQQLAEARAELAAAERELTAAEAAPDDPYTPGLEERLARQAITLAQQEVARREAAVARVNAAVAERERREAAAESEPAIEEAQPEPAAATEPAAAPSRPPPGLSIDLTPSDAPDASVEASVDADAEQVVGVGWNDGETWQEGIRRSAEAGNVTIIPGWPELNRRATEQLRNPDLALYRIQEAASKFSFLLVPLSLPFMALLFLWKWGVTLYDHVVYLLYGLSFASILFVALIITGSTPWLSWATPWLASLGLPVHMFFHLKGAYALGWWSALWRTFFMLWFALATSIVFLITIVIVGLVG